MKFDPPATFEWVSVFSHVCVHGCGIYSDYFRSTLLHLSGSRFLAMCVYTGVEYTVTISEVPCYI